ncbi:DUF3102 domain-containing protein [Yoonia algicola]|uniref:DUF3102 domain-containing protein n=1 Tax=Yoonia algicola TaxID=3137368 RepID=A0AAN0M6U0_9RHOB
MFQVTACHWIEYRDFIIQKQSLETSFERSHIHCTTLHDTARHCTTLHDTAEGMQMLDTATINSTIQDPNELSLTQAAQAALSINDMHREVQRLGRTAMEIAAEIGEELIEVKEEKLDHGQFIPWIEANCSFSRKRVHEYMKVAEAKCHSRVTFDRCTSIREVLAIGKDKPTPKQELRAATLDDLRKVERLRALRDDPGGE